MNEKKIGKEELKRLKDFEDTILNLKEEGAPKYQIDWDMEVQVKYDALIDHFGVESVSEAFETLQVSKDDLSDQPTYLDIYGYIEAKSKEKK
jgi:hypothetical protein